MELRRKNEGNTRKDTVPWRSQVSLRGFQEKATGKYKKCSQNIRQHWWGQDLRWELLILRTEEIKYSCTIHT